MAKAKKIKSRKKQVKSRARMRKRIVRRRTVKKEFLGTQETKIEQVKFSPSPPGYAKPAPAQATFSQELPGYSGQDKIVLQVRDPRWIHAYWEIRDETLERFKRELGDEFYRARRVLRVYDISHINFDGQNAHSFFDIEINELANNWYIDTAGPGRSWCVDLGLRLADGRFITILRSNAVHTPLDGPSWITDEEWMIPEDMFARLYGMGFGLGQSSPVGRAWQERVKKALFSGAFSSPVKKKS